MFSGWPRVLFVMLVSSAYVGLATASADREFGWVEQATGEMVRGVPNAERVPEGWRVGLAGGLEIQVAEGLTAERVPVLVSLVHDGLEQTGRGTFIIEESKPFLAGRLEAEVDGVPVRAGLRVRLQ